jgi:hypothetical protein
VAKGRTFTYLEVQVVDCGECAQAVVAYAEVGVVRLRSHVESQEE